MSGTTHIGTVGPNTMRDLEWSPSEKKIARKAFDLALGRELETVRVEARKRAEQVKQPSDLWNLEHYLTECGRQIDRQFDYRYSVLILVFGNLIRRGRLRKSELQGLSEDKLDAIPRFTL